MNQSTLYFQFASVFKSFLFALCSVGVPQLYLLLTLFWEEAGGAKHV